MPQKSTVTKFTPRKKQGVGAGRLMAKSEVQTIEVDLGGGDTMILYCKDLSVGTTRAFTRAANTNDMDLIVSTFQEIATDWATLDPNGKVIPIPDANGEPWEFTPENVDSLDIEVFQLVAQAVGKSN